MEKVLTAPNVESKGSQHMLEKETLTLLSDGVFLQQRLLSSPMNPLIS